MTGLKFNFPIPDVEVIQVTNARKVAYQLFSGKEWQVNQHEFAIRVEGVGSFYSRDGKEVEFSVMPGADTDWVNLSLNGQVLVSLLHQRKIINFHASSFIHDGRGIMILGETGAGKSSLAVSFAMSGAGFLSDDLTPVVFKGSKPYIRPLFRSVKLRENTVGQLNISRKNLREAEAGTGKQYLHIEHAGVDNYPLHTILKIEIGESLKPEFHEPAPADRFSLLRSEICSWEMLAGMPETEAEYLMQLVKIVEKVRFVRVVRPGKIEIAALHAAVSNYLAEAKG